MDEITIAQALIKVADAVDSLGYAIVFAAFIRGMLNK